MVRRSVLVRLVAVSLVAAACAIAATAWLTTQSTTSQIRGELKRTLEVDNDIYDELVDYGGSNDSWNDVGPLVATLAASTNRVITIGTSDGTVIASSAGAARTRVAPGAVAAALIDPLAPLRSGDATPTPKQITLAGLPAAAYVLAPDETASRAADVQNAMACGEKFGVQSRVVDSPYGASSVAYLGNSDAAEKAWASCDLAELQSPGRRYQSINNAIVSATASCLDARGLAYDMNMGGDDDHLLYLSVDTADDVATSAELACRDDAQRVAMKPYVAEPVLLYLDTPHVPSRSWIDSAGGTRIVLALLAVLAVTLLAAALGARRLLRPIRSLTRAAQRMSSGDMRARVRVTGGDEIARLGTAFNAMADSVEANEQQRKMLVSDVAHELRNPLANVRGYLEAAQDDVVRVDDTLIASLLEETMLLQHLIDDLQDLALADAGRLRIHREPTDAIALAEHVVAAHRPMSDSAGVALSLTGDRHVHALIDSVRIRQVLGNLVSNALRYTPAGGSVSVDVRRVEPSTLHIEVVDTGLGISADHLPHLFDRFYRADASRSRDTGGSGLGLAITRHLVEAHSGTIAVTSTPGAGTIFSITLPLGSTDPIEPARPAKRAPAGKRIPGSFAR